MMKDDATKQGHSCFGGCCDMRRAVLIVNKISFLMQVIHLFVVPFEVDLGASLSWFFVGIFAGMIINIMANIGARTFSACLVGIALFIYAAITIGFTILSFIATPFLLIYAVLCALFCYPHIMLLIEICNGTMTAENYHNEQQSCCCV
jgi:hypothetical protein